MSNITNKNEFIWKTLALHLRYSMVKSLDNVAEIKIGLRTPALCSIIPKKGLNYVG